MNKLIERIYRLGRDFLASWTFLIYAAGNTELEPEIYHAFTLIKEIHPLSGVNIVVQIARASTSLLRKFDKLVDYHGEDDWVGVRRYLIQSSGTYLIKQLPITSMAKPEVLYDFLIWAESNYPSDRTALFLSGHSSGFIGVMMDYEQNLGSFSLMSVIGLSRVLAAVYRHTGKPIDLLVLDTCFANMVEVWYELALLGGGSVNNLAVPVGALRREGLPCHFMIDMLQKSDPAKSLPSILDSLARKVKEWYGVNSSILIIKLQANLLTVLKSEISKITMILRSNRIELVKEFATCHTDWTNDTISILFLENWLKKFLPNLFSASNVLSHVIKKIVISPALSSLPASFRYGPSLLAVTTERYQLLEPYYIQMQFAAGNNWTQLLKGEASEAGVLSRAHSATVAVPKEVEADFQRK